MERPGLPALALLSAVPVMTKERFAELVGVEVGVVRGMLDRGYLPAIKIGRHRFVNLAVLQAQCLEDSENRIGEEPATYGGPGSPRRRERWQDKAKAGSECEAYR